MIQVECKPFITLRNENASTWLVRPNAGAAAECAGYITETPAGWEVDRLTGRRQTYKRLTNAVARMRKHVEDTWGPFIVLSPEEPDAPAAPVEKTPQDVLDDVFGPTEYLTRHVVVRGRHYQVFLRRDDVPAIELEDGLIRWTKGDGGPYTACKGGEIVLWSARGWNVGYAVWLPEMDGSK